MPGNGSTGSTASSESRCRRALNERPEGTVSHRDPIDRYDVRVPYSCLHVDSSRKTHSLFLFTEGA
jgi:hypothetical protein